MPKNIIIEGVEFETVQRSTYVRYGKTNDVMLSKVDKFRWNIHIHESVTGGKAPVIDKHEATTKETCVLWAISKGYLEPNSQNDVLKKLANEFPNRNKFPLPEPYLTQLASIEATHAETRVSMFHKVPTVSMVLYHKNGGTISCEDWPLTADVRYIYSIILPDKGVEKVLGAFFKDADAKTFAKKKFAADYLQLCTYPLKQRALFHEEVAPAFGVQWDSEFLKVK